MATMSDEIEGPVAGMSETEPDAVAVTDLGYAEASVELDGIIAELDRGIVDVDLLEERFRRAIEIIEELDRRIRGARERVDALLPRLEAVGRDGREGD
jgi:exonuclease VII small subunit